MSDIEIILNRDAGVRIISLPLEAPLPEVGDVSCGAFDWIGRWYQVWDPAAGYGWAHRAAHKTRIEPSGHKADVWFHFYAPLAHKGRSLSPTEQASIEGRIEETLRAVLQQEVTKSPGSMVYGVAMGAPDYMRKELEERLRSSARPQGI